MLHDWLKPGTPVPIDGIYRVHHYRHRLTHLAHIRFLRFPPCDKCGEAVAYEPVLILESCPLAPLLRDDPDFQSSTEAIPRKSDFPLRSA